MKATLLAVLLSAAICCAQDTEVSKQSLHGTISNLDAQPAPYNPSNSLRYAASPAPTLRSARRDSAPGPTLGAITDFQESYALPVFGQGNLGLAEPVYPGYFANSAPHRPVTRIHVRSGKQTSAAPAAHAAARRGR